MFRAIWGHLLAGRRLPRKRGRGCTSTTRSTSRPAASGLWMMWCWLLVSSPTSSVGPRSSGTCVMQRKQRSMAKITTKWISQWYFPTGWSHCSIYLSVRRSLQRFFSFLKKDSVDSMNDVFAWSACLERNRYDCVCEQDLFVMSKIKQVWGTTGAIHGYLNFYHLDCGHHLCALVAADEVTFAYHRYTCLIGRHSDAVLMLQARLLLLLLWHFFPFCDYRKGWGLAASSRSRSQSS